MSRDEWTDPPGTALMSQASGRFVGSGGPVSLAGREPSQSWGSPVITGLGPRRGDTRLVAAAPAAHRRGGRVVRQGSAKPCTPVQFRSPPRIGGSMPDLGRLAQGQSASLTRKRSEVQIL